MKEKNHKRKVALKKKRQLVVRKKTLKDDIADFVVCFWIRNTQHPLCEWERMMREGHKGFERMRGSEIIKNFEHIYSKLRTVKNDIGIWVEAPSKVWSDGCRYGKTTGLSDSERAKVINQLIIESDILMSRLMELAFDLDVEE